ncbi:GRB10-interacting GYF protein 2-like [Microplitis mediator]|uniref:GRB10-interacting GYF protein 2-like n=1 Tax=Microplitis mediator TaxID=375433 RepID=UPI002555ABF3|nr:GRB10-interacting GYF protein 2-like [Microplitis mediator]XP_057342049.1 GRB10-interacting GYF protein 2-like [Microplitis mediator]
MTDSMKFGPEWLRNLAGDSCNSGASGGGTANLITPRYQLAEHRYGREEMLALFDRNCKPPESIVGLQMLYVEKTQLPLAFIPETEDETRLRNSGLSSTGGRGRGGSVDRGGRIRTGRGGMYSSHFSRGFDDSGDGGNRIDAQSYPGRNRNFDRSQSERGWSERNGNIESNDWNGSTSPRKELSRGTSGSSLMESNWRRHRGTGDEEEGWRSNNSRSEKWIRGSWRDGGGSDRDRLDRADAEGDDNRISGRWETRASHRSSHDSTHHHHPPPSRTSRTWESNHHDNHDNLPEWATENPAESGGSFDASGAFHGGMFSDDDDEGTAGNHSNRTRRISEGTNSTNIKSGKPTSYSNNMNQNAHRPKINNDSINHTAARERPKSLHPFENKENSSEQGRADPSSKQSVTSTSSNPLTKSNTTSSINTTAKKVSNVVINSTKITPESERIQLPQRSKSFVELPSKNNNTNSNSSGSIPINSQQTNPVSRGSIQKNELLQTNLQNTLKKTAAATPVTTAAATNAAPHRPTLPQKLDDDLDGKNDADMQSFVAKLMADEESHREESSHVLPSVVNHVPPLASAASQEKWFYRDPQGEVQGPFIASEMAEWCKAGYFTPNLLVRRTCDDRYATLGDLMKLYGRVPFTPGPPIPPLKITEPVLPTIPPPVPTGLPGSALPKPGIEDPLLLLQYQQLQMIQNHQLLIRQMKNSAIAKLSQSENWSGLTPMEQNQLVMQCVMQNAEVRDISLAGNPFVSPLAAAPPPATNPVMQLFNQMQQAKVQSENHLPPNPHPVPPVLNPTPTLDPIQQLIQQMGGIQNLPGPPQPSINPSPIQQQQSAPEEDPIKSLLRQLHINANGHSQSHQMDSIWPQPPPQINPQFNAQSWLAQVGPLPAMPPGQMPNSLWDLHAKEIKTEQQILEEQNIRVQERKEELRKQEELKRQAEDASAKRKLEEEQNKKLEEAQRKEEERKRKEEEKRLKMEEKRKQEEEQKKKEDKKRKEEERKREEKRKQDEENNKKKQEEERKKREEAKKQEEKLRKEEEKRKKVEEEQRRLEEERLKREEEVRKKAEAEEQARRAEQRRREAEALKKLQEKSKAPWAQAPHAPPPASHASLAEIQRLEREKKAEELRLQQLLQQQLAQQKALEAAKEAAVAAESSKRLPFKWAEKAVPTTNHPQVKSLAQIQQEEQERIAKVKLQEKERSEKANQKEAAVVMQNAGIWGSASQSLNWTSNVNSASDASKFGSKAWTGSGFWDEPVAVKPAAPVKQPAKNSAVKATSQQHQQQQQQQQQMQQQAQQNNKPTKNKAKKEEETVKKLFENNTAKADDFTQWCNRTLSGLQVSVDVPTFVGFLRDIESAYEVKEYIKMYLGDNKQCTEFAKQFLEKRSKWRSSQRPQTEADDLCKPAPAINPNAPTEFQEVKGKSKKPKKGKMFKVDNRILGFSVTAATDRINVGDRDYGEGV